MRFETEEQKERFFKILNEIFEPLEEQIEETIKYINEYKEE